MTGATPAPGRSTRQHDEGPEHCDICELELVTICMVVDGNELVMHSCQRCDTRRWHLAGRPVGLREALAEVGEHAGRRR